MQVDVIRSIKGLEDIRGDWEALYEKDPDAQIFMSWFWMRSWLGRLSLPWFILGVKPDASAANYVAFLPLQPRTEMKQQGGFYNEYRLGGADFADYYGVLCDPAFEEEAIEALAEHIKTLAWTHFKLERFCATERRIHLFMKHFGKPRFVTEDIERFINKKTVNINIYPYVDLPGDWETYCSQKLSSNTRQKAKRFLKKVDEGKELRVTHATAETFKQDAEMLLKYWQIKWAPEKGGNAPGIVNNHRIMIDASFEAGALLLPVFKAGDKPLAALAILLDHRQKAMRFLIGGRDETFNSPPPGFVLHAHSIRWGIANGYKSYDFLMGNEPYKFMWGCQERYIRSVFVSTKSGENLGDKLDKSCLPYVFERSCELLKEGRTAEAEIGLQQILKVDEKHDGALLRLAELEDGRAHHREARKLFSAYLAVKPEDHAAWFKAGKSAQALKDTEGAIQSYRKVLELDPGNRDVAALLIELHLQTSKPKPTRSAAAIFAR